MIISIFMVLLTFRCRNSAERQRIAFAYIDRVTEQVIVGGTRERDRWVRNTATVRAAQVRSLLEGRPMDVNRVEKVLGYRLHQHHVGIVAWAERGEGTLVTLERCRPAR